MRIANDNDPCDFDQQYGAAKHDNDRLSDKEIDKELEDAGYDLDKLDARFARYIINRPYKRSASVIPLKRGDGKKLDCDQVALRKKRGKKYLIAASLICTIAVGGWAGYLLKNSQESP